MNETLSGLYELSFHICNVLLAAELFRKIVLKKNKYPLVMLCYLAALNWKLYHFTYWRRQCNFFCKWFIVYHTIGSLLIMFCFK